MDLDMVTWHLQGSGRDLEAPQQPTPRRLSGQSTLRPLRPPSAVSNRRSLPRTRYPDRALPPNWCALVSESPRDSVRPRRAVGGQPRAAASILLRRALLPSCHHLRASRLRSLIQKEDGCVMTADRAVTSAELKSFRIAGEDVANLARSYAHSNRTSCALCSASHDGSLNCLLGPVGHAAPRSCDQMAPRLS